MGVINSYLNEILILDNIYKDKNNFYNIIKYFNFMFIIFYNE